MPLHIMNVSVPAHGELWGRAWTQDFTLPSKVRRINGVMGCVTCAENTFLERRMTRDALKKSDYPALDLADAGARNDYAQDGKPTLTNRKLEATPRTTLIGSFSLCLNGTGVVCADVAAHALAKRRLHSTLSQNMLRLDAPIYVTTTTARISFSETETCPFLAPVEAVSANWAASAGNSDKLKDNIVPLIWQYWEARSGVRPTYDYSLKIYLDYD